MLSLYEIDREILSLVDPETGEIMDWDAFEQLQMDREKKIESVACWYKNLVAEAAAIREEEKNLADRRKKLENKAEARLKYLKNALNGQNFETSKCAITFRRSAKVNVNNEQAAVGWAEKNNRDDILKFVAPTVDKNMVAKLLREGINIPGVELEEGLSMGVK